MAVELELDLSYSKAQIQVFFPETFFPKFTVVRKGRRVGLTRGASQALIEYGLDETLWFLPKGPVYFMWADTVSSNIDRYFERYFQPILKQLPDDLWSWEQTKRILKVGRATIDFRSADRPENWEGFGYHIIFLNEAGIILEDDYLYDNAVLPMLMDFPNTKLIAAGVPKGKRHKKGIHKFFTIYEASLTDKVNYRSFQFSSYANPFIDKEAVDLIANAYDELTRKQEIEGEFVDTTDKPYLYAFSEVRHKKPYEFNPHLELVMSFDFNKEPCTALVGQKPTFGSLRCVHEIKIPSGSTPEVCDVIIAKYNSWLGRMKVTGDATGRNRTSMVQGNMNHYDIIMQKLSLKKADLLVPRQNPSHINSRILCNSVLQNGDISVTPECPVTISDCIFASVDDEGELIKTQAEGRHMLDNFRYLVEACFVDFIKKPHLYK